MEESWVIQAFLHVGSRLYDVIWMGDPDEQEADDQQFRAILEHFQARPTDG